MKVYVGGPLTTMNPDSSKSEAEQIQENINNAIDIGDQLLELNQREVYNQIIPFIPHLQYTWHLRHEKSFETWIAYDLKWLENCDVMYRILGPSFGTDLEEAHARKLGMPVYTSVEELIRAWISGSWREDSEDEQC